MCISSKHRDKAGKELVCFPCDSDKHLVSMWLMYACYLGDSRLVFFTEAEENFREKWPKRQPRCCHTCIFIAHHTDGHSSDGRTMSRGRPPSHRQEYNQNNNSNRKQLLSARFCWVMVFCLFVCFFATWAHDTLTINMPPSTSFRRLGRKYQSDKTKKTDKQKIQITKTFGAPCGSSSIHQNGFCSNWWTRLTLRRWMGTTEKCSLQRWN